MHCLWLDSGGQERIFRSALGLAVVARKGDYLAVIMPGCGEMQVRRVRCESSGVMVPKDKAIKRFIVRNIVDASAIRDIQDASVIDCEHRLLPHPSLFLTRSRGVSCVV